MSKFKFCIALVVLTVTGCASTGHSSGKYIYFQSFNPATEEVVAQVDTQFETACKGMLNHLAPEARSFHKCSSQNYAVSMPWRGTVPATTTSIKIVIDGKTEESCNVAAVSFGAVCAKK